MYTRLYIINGTDVKINITEILSLIFNPVKVLLTDFFEIISLIKNAACNPANWECPLGKPNEVAFIFGQFEKYPQSDAPNGLGPFPKIGI